VSIFRALCVIAFIVANRKIRNLETTEAVARALPNIDAASIFHALGNFEKAISEYSLILHALAAFHLVRLQRGRAQAALGRAEPAIADYFAVIAAHDAAEPEGPGSLSSRIYPPDRRSH
jgi:tetratricopeptide (TPR) repeat protein